MLKTNKNMDYLYNKFANGYLDSAINSSNSSYNRANSINIENSNTYEILC